MYKREKSEVDNAENGFWDLFASLAFAVGWMFFIAKIELPRSSRFLEGLACSVPFSCHSTLLWKCSMKQKGKTKWYIERFTKETTNDIRTNMLRHKPVDLFQENPTEGKRMIKNCKRGLTFWCEALCSTKTGASRAVRWFPVFWVDLAWCTFSAEKTDKNSTRSITICVVAQCSFGLCWHFYLTSCGTETNKGKNCLSWEKKRGVIWSTIFVRCLCIRNQFRDTGIGQCYVDHMLKTQPQEAA